MAVRIDVDGTETVVRPVNGKSFSLAELYEHVGCSVVEMVRLADDRIMWVDEEGKLRDDMKPANEKASRLLAEAGGMPGDFVVGPVLVTTVEEEETDDDDEEDD